MAAVTPLEQSSVSRVFFFFGVDGAGNEMRCVLVCTRTPNDSSLENLERSVLLESYNLFLSHTVYSSSSRLTSRLIFSHVHTSRFRFSMTILGQGVVCHTARTQGHGNRNCELLHKQA